MKKVIFASALAVVASSSFAVELWNNGTFVTGTGDGFGGANTSAIQPTYSVFGPNINGASFAVADDFTIAPGFTWTLNSLRFFSYQTQTTGVANNVSTFTGGRFGIFSAPPTDLTTNLIGGTLASNATFGGTAFTGTYRVTSTTLTNSARAIMSVDIDLGGLVLGAGTYWMAWGASGTLASGPWGVPVVPSGAGTNAMQWTGAAWGALDGDGVTAGVQPYDMAYIIDGDAVPEPATMIGLGAGVLALLRRRRTAKA